MSGVESGVEKSTCTVPTYLTYYSHKRSSGGKNDSVQYFILRIPPYAGGILIFQEFWIRDLRLDGR